MKNDKFELLFDQVTGGVKSLRILCDPDQMEWVKEGQSLNVPVDYRQAMWDRTDFGLKSLTESKDGANVVYANGIDCEWHVAYSFTENGDVKVENTLVNTLDVEEFFLPGQLGLKMTFFDDYKDAATCVKYRCHHHIWPKGDSAYVYVQKMGLGKDNLAVVFTEGSLDGYAQDDVTNSNDRGRFTLYPDPYILEPYGKWSLNYEIVYNTGKKDFARIMKSREDVVYVEVENETCFLGETLVARAYGPVTSVIANGAEVDGKYLTRVGNCCEVRLPCDKKGEVWLEFLYGEGRRSFARCVVRESLDAILDARVKYIVDNQQIHKAGSKLDGAFVIKDVETGRLYFDTITNDHNAGRERLGMGLLLARYLQARKNCKDYARYKKSFRKYIDFCLRELFDEKTGAVFNTVGRQDEDWGPRLYNIPWMARLLCEGYKVTGEEQLLKYSAMAMDYYYEMDGRKFYPNAISVNMLVNEMNGAGMTAEADKLKRQFLEHVEQIIERGLNYPKHEVNYEQTIVNPAVTYILDACALTGDKRYLAEVVPHIKALHNFDGIQPSYFLDSVAIRYWDDFWFGKALTHGDTLHYWSALSSESYMKYYLLTGDENARKEGEKGLRNCLNLFMDDGTASCAYLVPTTIKGRKGEFFDPFMNDQDFALYFALIYLDKRA